jgi:flagella basal body P-ring formation protein FlgA
MLTKMSLMKMSMRHVNPQVGLALRCIRGAALGFTLSLAWTTPLAAADSLAERAQGAIVLAVREKLGAAADVRVDDLRVTGALDGAIVAQPVPGARTGGRIRFVLRPADGQPRSADADAVVTVSLPHLRAARTLRRGEPIEADAVVEETSEIAGLPLQPLPNRHSLAGATVVRDVNANDLILPAMVAPAIIVKPGDKVLVRAFGSGLEVQATLIAAQAGRLGDVIRCVNPDTRRAMAVRIVGRGVAEMTNAF